MKVELDGRNMTDRETAHAYLAQELAFPDYYGKNLDALYDLLTEATEPREIRLTHVSQLKAQLGYYAELLLTTLQEAENDSLNLTVTILE